MPERRVARLVLLLLAVIGCVLVIGFLVVRRALVASLPQVGGARALAGLAAPVRVDRDALGIPTIRGTNRLDVARATGFVHAQDRFFQMDLSRRLAAGELSELLGPSTLASDKTTRIHRLRAVAREVLARALPAERVLLEAYADGVNAGLAVLGARPPEYLLLRSQPAAWRAEDSVLVLGAMFVEFDLLDLSRRELELQAMYDALPAPLVDFLRPLGDEWDAPLVGDVMIPAPMPGPDVFDLRNPANARSPMRTSVRPGSVEERTSPRDPPLGGMAVAAAAGSNAWAVAGSHTSDNRALVASDPHLPLRVPNVWYRVSLEWRDEQAAAHRATGAGLPGLPFVGIGSNGHVAWGFTVAFDDRSDMVVVEREPAHPDMYRTPEGPKAFEHTLERIRVKGAADVPLEITSTIWGPLVGRDDQGHPIAHQWQAHHPEGLNLTFAQIEEAETAEAAIDLANRSGMPSYNLIVADDRGSIGWTVTGRLPRRVGFDGRVPTSRVDGTRRWDGWLEPAEYPRVVNPGSGRVWTSNHRLVPRPLLDRLGLEGYVMGPRARQVRDDLMARDRVTPRDLLEIQFDDRALFLERWRTFLLDELRDDKTRDRPERREFRRMVQASWNGHAAASSVGYLLVHRFRHELAQLTIGPLVPSPVQHAFRPGEWVQWWESALWRLVHERPRHLLAPRWNDWTEVTLAAVDATIAAATTDGRPLSRATWGSTTAHMAHPLSPAVPWLAGWLDMLFVPMPGDANMPRLRQPSEFGDVSATLRMVVSPGHEETGIFCMPGGQSGHPLSPHYRDMHERWVEDRATPFLPGPTVQTLTLQPVASLAPSPGAF